MHAEVAMDRGTVETEVDPKGDRCPGRILGRAVEACLRDLARVLKDGRRLTLFALCPFKYEKVALVCAFVGSMLDTTVSISRTRGICMRIECRDYEKCGLRDALDVWSNAAYWHFSDLFVAFIPSYSRKWQMLPGQSSGHHCSCANEPLGLFLRKYSRRTCISSS